MLDKRQIWAMFLFEFKMSCNRDNSQYHNAFGRGTANKHTVQWWFKKFCRGDESLEVEEHSDQPSEVDNDQLRGSLKLILLQLQLHEKLPKNLTLTILPSFSIWSKLERLKSSISGYLLSWLLIKKIVILKCLPFFYTVNHFSVCDVRWRVDFIQQPRDDLLSD